MQRGSTALPQPVAAALLRPASGRSRVEPGAPLPPQNVHEFYASPETAAAAADGLRALGFVVRAQSRLAVSFAGPKELFERAFGAPLTLLRLDPKTGRPSPEGVPAGYAAQGPLTVPEALQPYVEQITLQQGVRYWEPEGRR
ncbi:MAG: hypothetical protein K6T75_04825 [Acetobacteraceae bacterium]|nr:hypothetical protein [Acetobacteraceae bacterium]